MSNIKKKMEFKKTSEDVRRREIERNNIRQKLGIPVLIREVAFYDDYNEKNKKFKAISTLYEHLEEYRNDIYKTESFLLSNKEIPKELYEKLIKTKLELDSHNVEISELII